MNKQKILKLGGTLLKIWGGISLIGLIGIGGFLLFSLGPGNKTEINQATKSDVRFVLNWCGLGDNRIEEVLNSQVSARSFTGDHLDAYQIRISHVTIDELTRQQEHRLKTWYRCDSLPQILDGAVELVCGWQHEIDWFPIEKEIRTTNFYVYPWKISSHGISPDAAQLIFVEPRTNMIYYVSTSM
jgi:hypothetical protein